MAQAILSDRPRRLRLGCAVLAACAAMLSGCRSRQAALGDSGLTHAQEQVAASPAEDWTVIFASSRGVDEVIAVFRSRIDRYGFVAWRDGAEAFVIRSITDMDFGPGRITKIDLSAGDPLDREEFDELLDVEAQVRRIPTPPMRVFDETNFYICVVDHGNMLKYKTHNVHIRLASPDLWSRFYEVTDPLWKDCE